MFTLCRQHELNYGSENTEFQKKLTPSQGVCTRIFLDGSILIFSPSDPLAVDFSFC
jgi:hypothetical protein